MKPLPFLLALSLSCSMSTPSPFDDEWILTSMSGRAPIEGSRITLTFDGKTAGGYSGCNWYGSTYTTNGSQLTFGQGESTARGCNSMQQETEYQRLLRRTATYAREGETLTLKDQSGTALLEFRRRAPEPMNPADLVGTRWRVGDSDVTLIFTADGISGFAGCRGYTGTYSATGDKLRVSSISMDSTECGKSEAVMLQEGQFTTDLSEAVNYRLQPGRLEIITVTGRAVVMKKQ